MQEVGGALRNLCVALCLCGKGDYSDIHRRGAEERRDYAENFSDCDTTTVRRKPIGDTQA